MIGLTSLAVTTGRELLPIECLPELLTLADNERAVVSALGIETVAHDPAASPVALVSDASSRALASAQIEGGDLDALIVIPARTPDLLVASESTRLQAAIGARRAVTFSVGDLGCASIGAALLTARSLLIANPGWDHVLVVHASVPPPGSRYRHPVTLSGAAGAAILIGRTDNLALLDLAVESDGRYWDLFAIEFEGLPAEEWVERCRDAREYSFSLAVDSRIRFRDQTAAVMSRLGLTLANVDRFVMQNISESAFQFYEDAFEIAVARSCRVNLRRFGHLGAIDVVLNLQTAAATGEIASGERVLLFSNSPSAAWSTVVVQA